MALPCFRCRAPIEPGDEIAWFDDFEWTPGGTAGPNLLPHGHDRPAHARCSDDPGALSGGEQAALDAGFSPWAGPPAD